MRTVIDLDVHGTDTELGKSRINVEKTVGAYENWRPTITDTSHVAG